MSRAASRQTTARRPEEGWETWENPEFKVDGGEGREGGSARASERGRDFEQIGKQNK